MHGGKQGGGAQVGQMDARANGVSDINLFLKFTRAASLYGKLWEPNLKKHLSFFDQTNIF